MPTPSVTDLTKRLLQRRLPFTLQVSAYSLEGDEFMTIVHVYPDKGQIQGVLDLAKEMGLTPELGNESIKSSDGSASSGGRYDPRRGSSLPFGVVAVCESFSGMERALKITAALGSVLVFASYAASWKATLAVLAGYALLFVYLSPLALAISFRRVALRGADSAFAKKVANLPLISYPVMLGILIVNPFGQEETSSQQFTTFGEPQVVGLICLGLTVLGLSAFAARRKYQTYRKCPHCISHIPRQASRCKYCTQPVNPAPVLRPAARVAQQPRKVTTSSATATYWETPRYMEPGHKDDFGKLSAPRPQITAAARSRPLPSEVDAARRPRR